jgi:hypothetical protein
MYTFNVGSKAEVQMGPRSFGPFLIVGNFAAIAAAIILIMPAEAQTPGPVKTPPSAKAWVPPRTPDGQPDLQGVWTNATLTPFERSPGLAANATITEEEAARIEKRASENRVDRPPQPGDPGNYNQVFFDGGTTWLSTRQSSLVVDPPNGRVPVKASAAAQREYDLAHVADSYEHQTSWERCITRGFPAGMFPAGYDNAYQIVQTRGYVVILSEMIHEARIIPVDGRPHLPQSIRVWNGDPVGRWEGDTLVVDTTNFNGRGNIATSAATGRIRGIHESEALHVVERFTRVNANMLSYEVIIDDPEMYSARWKVSMPFAKDENYRIYEYACHEGNFAMEDILRGGRAKEKSMGAAK